jgi:hypothetical protein
VGPNYLTKRTIDPGGRDKHFDLAVKQFMRLREWWGRGRSAGGRLTSELRLGGEKGAARIGDR